MARLCAQAAGCRQRPRFLSVPCRFWPFLFPADPVSAFHSSSLLFSHFLTAHAQLLLALACSCLLLLTMAVSAGYCLLWRGIACYVVAGGGYWRRGGRGRGGAVLSSFAYPNELQRTLPAWAQAK